MRTVPGMMLPAEGLLALAEQLPGHVLRGTESRHPAELHHPRAAVLVAAHRLGEGGLRRLLLLNPGPGGRVLPLVQGFPGVHGRAGEPADALL